MTFAQNLYTQLMTLVANSDEKGFFFKDITFKDKQYRVFNYHIPRTKAWEQPNALDCRGTMFDITQSTVEPMLVALSMPKFFNWNENKFSNVDIYDIAALYPKLDGSLISSFLIDGEIWLKSKTEVNKSHSINSMKLLNANEIQKAFVMHLTHQGYTVDFEYIGPENHFIVNYPENKLTILMARSKLTGELLFGHELNEKAKAFHVDWDESWCITPIAVNSDAQKLIHIIPEGTEGYVAITHNRQLVKVKSDWYTSQHLALGDTSSKRIWECVCANSSDDLKALLVRQNRMSDEVLTKIEKAEQKLNDLLCQWDLVNQLVSETMDLDKKSFVLKIKEQHPLFLSLAISLREGKFIDLKKFLLNL